MNDKIRELQRKIEQEERRIKNCKHDFEEPFFNPEKTKEPYFKTVARGSDIGSEIDGYRDVTKDRWTRECNICGYRQHTYKLEPIIKGQRPSF